MERQAFLKCAYCGKSLTVEEAVTASIDQRSRKDPTFYERQFHFDCLKKYRDERHDEQLVKEERSDWDACYQYFKTKLMGIDESRPMDKYAAICLRGLRVGLKNPYGAKTMTVKAGYSYRTILITMKYCSVQIQRAVMNKDFGEGNYGFKRKVNYIMAILFNHINDVQARLDKVDRQNKRVEKRVEERKPEVVTTAQTYKRKGTGKRRVVLD